MSNVSGGNAIGQNKKAIGKEIFIRWFQLTTFLQSMQVSKTPWEYDEETISISKFMILLKQSRSTKIELL